MGISSIKWMRWKALIMEHIKSISNWNKQHYFAFCKHLNSMKMVEFNIEFITLPLKSEKNYNYYRVYQDENLTKKIVEKKYRNKIDWGGYRKWM